MSDSFFVQPETSPNAILLVDASGSVRNIFDQKNSESVFGKMEKICSSLPHNEFRVVFWNSDNPDKKFPASGVLKVPAAVPKEKLSNWFRIASADIEGSCLTMPHLAFSQIDDWLEKYSRCIYFVTDGFMGWPGVSSAQQTQLNSKFVSAIKDLVTKYRDAQLSILAVECNASTNYNVIESMSSVVGNDVYKAISENRLTNLIAKFISYTPVHHIDGYAHIDRVQVPKGMIPFGRRYFSPLSVPQFMLFVSKTVEENKDNENALLKIVQDLSATLVALTTDKPASIRAKTMDIFCNMFEKTAIDSATAQFLLARGMSGESSGSAQLHAEYRANMKQLFANAGKMLRDDAAQAMSIRDRSLTLPLSLSSSSTTKVVLVSRSNTVDQRVCDHNNGGFLVEKTLIPVVPFISTQDGLMPKQCTRQWIRLLLSKQYNLDSSSDEIIFVMMTINLQVQLTLSVDASTSTAYKNLVSIMLEKKRANSQKTEMEQLLAGNLFVPNDGNLTRFTTFLQNSARRLGIQDVEPLRLWYFLCLAHSAALASSQMIHCEKHVKSGETLADFAKQYADSMPKLLFYELPEELEFVCLITMDSTRETGGFKFVPHKNAIGSECCPRQVLSAIGVEQLLSNRATSLCPVCYTALQKTDFVKEGPQTIGDQKKLPFSFSDIDTSMFKSGSYSVAAVAAPHPSTFSSSSSSSTSSSSTSSGTLVILKGTVGCGKTTYAKKFQELAEKAGRRCFVEGSDKYVMQGFGFGAPAAAQVKFALQQALQAPEKNKIVVIDGCNEKFQKNNVYGVDFSNWRVETVWVNLDRKQLDNYLAWSLCNVLRRQKDDSVLTVGKLGFEKCTEVHMNKARAHFGKKISDVAASASSADDVLSRLKNDCEAYNRYLEQHKEEFEPKLPS